VKSGVHKSSLSLKEYVARFVQPFLKPRHSGYILFFRTNHHHILEKKDHTRLPSAFHIAALQPPMPLLCTPLCRAPQREPGRRRPPLASMPADAVPEAYTPRHG
jgi:hypothetical protein